MAALRLLLVTFAISAFFVVGVPAQTIVRRAMPRAAHRIPLLFCRTMLRLAKICVEVRGRPSPSPALLASNHVSWIDILALGSVAPFCFLAKLDIASWPLLSRFASVQGTVFVDRERRRTILPANRALAARMREGRIALLFPEGTTIAGPLPAPFLSSHFEAAHLVYADEPGHPPVMIQPVAIAYSSAAAAWVGDDDLLSHLWRTLRAPPLRCHVAFGTPVAVEERMTREDMAVAMRAAVVAMLGLSPAADVHAAETSPAERCATA